MIALKISFQANMIMFFSSVYLAPKKYSAPASDPLIDFGQKTLSMLCIPMSIE